MLELDLPACPICGAENSQSLNTLKKPGEPLTWYECRACASVLLSLDDGRWAYQRVGRPEKSYLRKQPLSVAELQGLLLAEDPSPAPGGQAGLARQAAAKPPQRLHRNPPAALEPVKERSPILVGTLIAVTLFLAGLLLLVLVKSLVHRPEPPPTVAAMGVSFDPDVTATSTPTLTALPSATPATVLRSNPTPLPGGSPMAIGPWQIQVRQVLIADSIASPYSDERAQATGRFVLLFMTVTNQGRSPDTFVAFTTLAVEDAEGRRYEENTLATHYAQATYRTSLAVDVEPDTGAYIVVVYDVSLASNFYALVPGLLADQHRAGVLLDIP